MTKIITGFPLLLLRLNHQERASKLVRQAVTTARPTEEEHGIAKHHPAYIASPPTPEADLGRRTGVAGRRASLLW